MVTEPESERQYRLRVRAHQIWEREGRPEGKEGEHWAQAEKELQDDANRSVDLFMAASTTGQDPRDPASFENTPHGAGPMPSGPAVSGGAEEGAQERPPNAKERRREARAASRAARKR